MGLSYQKIAQLELKTAIDAAHAEPSSRGRCQALAWVARHVRDQKNVRKTAEAAIKAAGQDDDLYTSVFPLAWPIRALIERGEQKAATQELERALHKSDAITPTSSRSEAVFLLFQGAMFGPDRLWLPAFEKLKAISLPTEHWRQRRNLRDALLMVASVDFLFARAATEELPDEKLKQDVLRLMKERKLQTARPFFW